MLKHICLECCSASCPQRAPLPHSRVAVFQAQLYRAALLAAELCLGGVGLAMCKQKCLSAALFAEEVGATGGHSEVELRYP